MTCEYGHGRCTAPETKCIHWQGTFCELDKEAEEQETEREQYLLSPVLYQAYIDTVDKFEKYIKEHPEIIEEGLRKYFEQFVDVRDIALGDKEPFGNLNPAEIPTELHTYSYKSIRDCHKCVYEVGCHGNPVGCKSYKRDAPDGGYYG